MSPAVSDTARLQRAAYERQAFAVFAKQLRSFWPRMKLRMQARATSHVTAWLDDRLRRDAGLGPNRAPMPPMSPVLRNWLR